MSNPENIEERLVIATDAFAALIAADPYFVGVPVLTERKGDISAMIIQALSKLGLCVVVVAPDGDQLTRTGNELSLRVRLVAQISEQYLINNGATGSKKPALAATTRVMKAVDRKPNGLDVGRHITDLNEFTLDPDQPFKLTPDKGFIVYQVTAFTTIEL